MTLPAPFELAGKIVPSVRGLPNGSVDAAIGNYVGDLAILAMMAFLPNIVDSIKANIPAEVRHSTHHLQTAANVGGMLYVGNVLDAVFAKLAGEVNIRSDVKSGLYLALWWIPSRLTLFNGLAERFRWLTKGFSNDNTLIHRGVAVALYFGVALISRDVLDLPVSSVFGLGVLPALVALLKA